MADSTDASPTGDPLIAQSEQEADAQRAARAANLFDVRRLIGALFIVYGVILLVLGFLESDASIEKSAGVNVNLWAGLGMLVFGLIFMAWALLRPLGEELAADNAARASEQASREPGGDADSTGGSRAAGGQ